MKENFWQTKDMKKLTSQEWDAICDKCGLCCLHKIIDDDTNELFYTNVACNLLDLETRQCSNYENRLHLNSSCIPNRFQLFTVQVSLPHSLVALLASPAFLNELSSQLHLLGRDLLHVEESVDAASEAVVAYS